MKSVNRRGNVEGMHALSSASWHELGHVLSANSLFLLARVQTNVLLFYTEIEKNARSAEKNAANCAASFFSHAACSGDMRQLQNIHKLELQKTEDYWIEGFRLKSPPPEITRRFTAANMDGLVFHSGE